MARELEYRLTADDELMRTGIGVRRDHAIRIAGDRSGVAHYGPYLPLAPGDYRARFVFCGDKPCRGRAVMDVCVALGTRTLARRELAGEQIADGGMTASLDFSCDQPVADIEVRLIVEEGFVGDLIALEIVGELAPLYRRVEIADLPAVPIKEGVSRGRSLYDGYRRGVGLQFTDLSQKISRDPDFREARELAGARTIVGELNLCNIFLIFKFYLPHLPASGHIAEFGSYRGGGAIFMAALARRFLPGARVFGFDTFAGMPPTDDRVDHHKAGAFAGVDYAELCSYVEQIGLVDNLEFVRGDFAATAAPTLRRVGTVSFCHIDCDIRSAIECAYDAAKPHMVTGGYWIFDDPTDADCLGAAEAMEDLLIRRDGLNSEQIFPHYVFRKC